MKRYNIEHKIQNNCRFWARTSIYCIFLWSFEDKKYDFFGLTKKRLKFTTYISFILLQNLLVLLQCLNPFYVDQICKCKRSSLRWLWNWTYAFSQQGIFWNLGTGWSLKKNRMIRMHAVQLQTSVHDSLVVGNIFLYEPRLSSTIDLVFLPWLFVSTGLEG